MEEILLHKKLAYQDLMREKRLNELKAFTISAWIEREIKYGFVESELDIIEDIENTLLKWLVENENFEDAAWLKKELDSAKSSIRSETK